MLRFFSVTEWKKGEKTKAARKAEKSKAIEKLKQIKSRVVLSPSCLEKTLEQFGKV